MCCQTSALSKEPSDAAVTNAFHHVTRSHAPPPSRCEEDEEGGGEEEGWGGVWGEGAAEYADASEACPEVVLWRELRQ